MKPHWSTFTLVDSDGHAIQHDGKEYDPDDMYDEAMREYKETGSIHGMFFAGSPRPETAWQWKPPISGIDWAGMPEQLS